MAKGTYVKVGGTWKKVVSVWRNIGGTFYKDTMLKTNVANVWKECIEYGGKIFANLQTLFKVTRYLDTTGRSPKGTPVEAVKFTSMTSDRNDSIYVAMDKTIIKYDKDMNEITRRTFSNAEMICYSGFPLTVQCCSEDYLYVNTSSTNTSASVYYIYRIPLNLLGVPDLFYSREDLGIKAIRFLSPDRIIVPAVMTGTNYINVFSETTKERLEYKSVGSIGTLKFGTLTKSGKIIYARESSTNGLFIDMLDCKNLALPVVNIATDTTGTVSLDTATSNKDEDVYLLSRAGSSSNGQTFRKYNTVTKVLTTLYASMGRDSNPYDWCATGMVDQIICNLKGDLFAVQDANISKLPPEIKANSAWLINTGSMVIDEIIVSGGEIAAYPDKWV